MDAGDAVALMHEAAARKAGLIERTAPELLSKTILVLQLMEAHANEVANYVVYEDFAGFGFAEVWAADWTGLALTATSSWSGSIRPSGTATTTASAASRTAEELLRG